MNPSKQFEGRIYDPDLRKFGYLVRLDDGNVAVEDEEADVLFDGEDQVQTVKSLSFYDIEDEEPIMAISIIGSIDKPIQLLCIQGENEGEIIEIEPHRFGYNIFWSGTTKSVADSLDVLCVILK
ncbi:hypothetical protein [Paenibacillus sp. LHD-38]|uniref:hypothetical protein n=1 Tax=Paenibacillus sp. LHD-38 TaxID=3072143 RepID=UPI00280DCA50|nr:hypothetical protein [Paenibacillus sp. LHD-38]MDQ8736405.1 hypothetical protein [Paenibacillus sp. LHD-38]